MSKLLGTFVKKEKVEDFIYDLSKKYEVLYNRIFVFNIENDNEFLLTYNLDMGNISIIPINTISLHRKKDYNTMYSLNGLNILIKTLNNNVLDKKFPIDWSNYRNKIILSNKDELNIMKTELHKIKKVL